MSDFRRARTDEQKAFRIDEVKKATERLFEEHPYHEITLSSIGDQLGWSRANLYKYITSKEEIFLLLAQDAKDKYCNDLITEFSNRSNLIKQEIARKWAEIAEDNKKWFLYGSILVSIVEQNVTLENLKVFKKSYYDSLSELTEKISSSLGVSEEDFATLFGYVHFQACGLVGVCNTNPLVKQAIDELGIKNRNDNFRSEMDKFILMCLEHFC